jgi:dynein intermediate chain 1
MYLDNFYEQESGENGCVCVFSLKNPSYPEYLCQAQSGVICVDIHSEHPHMLAAGLADGNVSNTQRKKKVLQLELLGSNTLCIQAKKW